MNKTFKRVISILLVGLMLMFNTSVYGFAENGENPTPTPGPEFELSKFSETPSEVVFSVKLLSGNVTAFVITPSTELSFKSAVTNKEITGLSVEENIVTFNGVSSFTEDTQVVLYTCTKSTATGIVKSDFSITVTDCMSGESTLTPEVTNSIPETHSHDCEDTVVDPTCIAKGYTHHVCKECNYEYNDTETEKNLTNHTHTDTRVTKEATCKEKGVLETYCVDCGAHIKNDDIEINSSNHTHTDTRVTKEATCKEKGVLETYCVDCGAHIKNDDIEIDSSNHVHTATRVTKAATCNETGVLETYCVDCGAHIKNEDIQIDSSNHIHTAKRVARPATCSLEGIEETYCTDCQAVISTAPIEKTAHKYVNCFRDADCTNDGYSYKECSVCHDRINYTTIPATNHSWTEWTVVTNATPSTPGLKRRHCKLCNEVQDVEIPKVIVPVTEIILMPDQNITMDYKKTTQIYINVTPDDAVYSAEFVWSSSNPRVATVDENGLVTAKGFGTTTITVKTKDGKVSASKKVTVQFSIIQLFVYLFDKIFG